MTRPYVLIDRESWRPFFSLVFFCGVALVLMTPGARTVRDLVGERFLAGSPVFFTAYVLFFGLLGLGVGTASAERGETGARMLAWLALRVLLGQLLCLPYLVFAHALVPSPLGTLALIALYATLVSTLCATVGRLAEQPRRSHPAVGFVVKYAFFASYNVAPLPWMPFVSPLGGVRRLLGGTTGPEAIVVIAIPAVLSALFAAISVRLKGGTDV